MVGCPGGVGGGLVAAGEVDVADLLTVTEAFSHVFSSGFDTNFRRVGAQAVNDLEEAFHSIDNLIKVAGLKPANRFRRCFQAFGRTVRRLEMMTLSTISGNTSRCQVVSEPFPVPQG